MTSMLLGLVLFFSAHSLQIARRVRLSLLERMGTTPYRAVYSIVSLVGLVLIGFGFADYRSGGLIPVWFPPLWMKHMALLLNWFAIVFFAAAYLPCYIRRTLRHPMLTGVLILAITHLLTNGDAGGMILFGTFLFWAVAVRIDTRFRTVDKSPVRASMLFDFLALAIGSASYAIIVFWLHPNIFNIPVWPG
ncbi:MAG: NnrU family protein [Betaproteobacteria bacterium]|nr:NnrU family protein [Betaproteobacteria bacterium]